MPSIRRRLTGMLALTGALLCTNATAEGIGLRVTAGDDLWPRWQARLVATTSLSLWRHAVPDRSDLVRARQDSISLLGDYYFGPPQSRRHEVSGFRATSGLIIGPVGGQALSPFGDAWRGVSRSGTGISYPSSTEPRGVVSSLDSAPYLGIGYTALSAKAGWGFSADIGVAARNGASPARFGRVFLGTQSLDDLVREMRLTPLLNVGVSYSF